MFQIHVSAQVIRVATLAEAERQASELIVDGATDVTIVWLPKEIA